MCIRDSFNFKLKNRSALDPMKFRPERRLSPVNPKAALWIIPSGSRNVLASSLGIMHQGIDSFRRISHMKKRKIDVIGVTIACLLYTSDAADERSSVDLGGRRII